MEQRTYRMWNRGHGDRPPPAWKRENRFEGENLGACDDQAKSWFDAESQKPENSGDRMELIRIDAPPVPEQTTVLLKINEEKPAEGAKKYPPISHGAVVATTQENVSLQDEWQEGARKNCQWGVEGVVLMHHDSHGLCYQVSHGPGLIATYDPTELTDTGRHADKEWYKSRGFNGDGDTMA